MIDTFEVFLVAGLFACIIFAICFYPIAKHSLQRYAVYCGLMVACTLATYALVGAPAALHHTLVSTPQTLDEAIVLLKQQLNQHPEQADGWFLLGKAYLSQQRYPESVQALDRATRLAPDQPEILVASAQARLLAQTHPIPDPEAVRRLDRALQIAPNYALALLLKGVALKQAGQPEQAAKLWRSAKQFTTPQARPLLDKYILESEQEGKLARKAAQ